MSRNILLMILLAALVSYLPRVIPLLALKNVELPKSLQKWMAYIPISIFAALIASDIFFAGEQISFSLLNNTKLLPSLITVFVAYKTKNMIYSIIAGVLAISVMVFII